jgi:hypothetical protein
MGNCHDEPSDACGPRKVKLGSRVCRAPSEVPAQYALSSASQKSDVERHIALNHLSRNRRHVE